MGRLALAVVAALALVSVETAFAQPGRLVADLTTTEIGGVNVAFDGTHLYYTGRNGTTLHRVATDGSGHTTTPIVGAAGVNALAYDVVRDSFWAVDATGLNVYRVRRDGVALPQFTIVPVVDLPGSCGAALTCSSLVSGLAYDATDDSLWYVPSGSTRAYHFDTVGQLLGYVDLAFAPECLGNAGSGIVAGASSLYVTPSACARGFRTSKNGSRIESFTVTSSAQGDVECDNRTQTVHVMWVRDVADGHLRAFEVEPGSCSYGGGLALPTHTEWFTGGGTSPGTVVGGQFEGIEVRHGFHLYCNTPEDPDSLQLVWTSDVDQSHNRFHMSSQGVVLAACDLVFPPGDPSPPASEVNRIQGRGTGRLNGNAPCEQQGTGFVLPPGQAACGYVEWGLIDGGEPNTERNEPDDDDAVQYRVFRIDANPGTNDGDPIMIVDCEIGGNVQAHDPPVS